MQKSVRRIHDAVYEPIADLATWRAMPTHSIDHLDPFLFLNHHGPQEYGPNNNGLPFGPHPHRGFETLTFVLQGDITHKDSVSGESVITAGGIQWMTAGSGLIHAEVSSDEFKQRGGWEEVIQLWMNLPAKFKMTEPNYTGLQEADITAIEVAGGQGTLKLVSGTYGDHEGPIDSLTNLFTSTLTLREGAEFVDRVPEDCAVLFYVVNGAVDLNGTPVQTHQLVEFDEGGRDLVIRAQEDSTIIYCYGTPFDEPIVAHGPFVMNTEAEIQEAMRDYRMGKMGGF